MHKSSPFGQTGPKGGVFYDGSGISGPGPAAGEALAHRKGLPECLLDRGTDLYAGAGAAELVWLHGPGEGGGRDRSLRAALATGFSLYDDLAKVAGAGTLVPITGFANSVVAPSIEFSSEGILTGTCVKAFSIAGPVIVIGTAASVAYGLLYWLWGLI